MWSALSLKLPTPETCRLAQLVGRHNPKVLGSIHILTIIVFSQSYYLTISTFQRPSVSKDNSIIDNILITWKNRTQCGTDTSTQVTSARPRLAEQALVLLRFDSRYLPAMRNCSLLSSRGLKLQISTVVFPARRHMIAHTSRLNTTFHTVSLGAVISRTYAPEPTSNKRTRPSFPPVTRNCSSNCNDVTDESCAAIRVCTRRSGSAKASTRPSAPPVTSVCGVSCREHTSAV
jgi:hypothetical protein